MFCNSYRLRNLFIGITVSVLKTIFLFVFAWYEIKCLLQWPNFAVKEHVTLIRLSADHKCYTYCENAVLDHGLTRIHKLHLLASLLFAESFVGSIFECSRPHLIQDGSIGSRLKLLGAQSISSMWSEKHSLWFSQTDKAIHLETFWIVISRNSTM